MSASRIDITDEVVRHAQPPIGEDRVSVPLIDDSQRSTRFDRIFAEKG